MPKADLDVGCTICTTPSPVDQVDLHCPPNVTCACVKRPRKKERGCAKTQTSLGLPRKLTIWKENVSEGPCQGSPLRKPTIKTEAVSFAVHMRPSEVERERIPRLRMTSTTLLQPMTGPNLCQTALFASLVNADEVCEAESRCCDPEAKWFKLEGSRVMRSIMFDAVIDSFEPKRGSGNLGHNGQSSPGTRRVISGRCGLEGIVGW